MAAGQNERVARRTGFYQINTTDQLVLQIGVEVVFLRGRVKHRQPAF